MSKSHLSIEVHGQQVRFTSFTGTEIIIEQETSVSSNEYSDVKASLDSFITTNESLNKEFDNISLSYASNKSSLVPNNVFAESSSDDIFKLCFGKCNDSSSIDYNRISELSIVNVFEIYDWVKRYFVIKFPRISIQHEGSHSLRSILETNAFYLKATIILHSNYFQLSVVKHNQVEFYSFFDYQNHEDVLYHVLFALKQKEFTEEDGSIEIINGLGSNKEIVDSISKDLSRIKDLAKLKPSYPSHFIAKSQLLCV